jgi:hypothetical protein
MEFIESMKIVQELEPTRCEKVMDLVSAAGIDTSNWASSRTGKANPHFCYRWAFMQAGKVIALNV